MSLESIHSINFRNLNNQEVPFFDSKDVFFVGENGQGKTSFLEAIYFLCYASSFRTKKDSEIITFKNDETQVKGIFKSSDEINDVRIAIKKNSRIITFDEEIIKDRKNLIYKHPCICFVQSDSKYLIGTPEDQRNFIDQTISLFNISYIDLVRKYKKCLKIHNILLASEDKNSLNIWEEQLIDLGFEIIKERENLVKELNELLIGFFSSFTKVDGLFEIKYLKSWKSLDKQLIRDKLIERRPLDKIMKITSSGPHRDKFFFSFNDTDFCTRASTGQIRLVSLLLKTIQAIFFNQKTHKNPILLFDDVLLELDSKIKNEILNFIPEAEQKFFTLLPEEKEIYKTIKNPLVLKIINGSAFDEYKR